MKWLIFFCLLLGVAVYAEISLENAPNLPDMDDFSAIKEKCNKKGGEGTYEKVKKAREETQKCIKDLIDVTKVKDEVEEAKKTGSMDEVFGKYCGKRPQLKECIKKTSDVAKQCMEDTEKDALNTVTNILEQIGDFVCYRDGDRIAMFVAEGGVECIQSRVEGIRQCVNQTLKFDTSQMNMSYLSTFANLKERCSDFGKIQECVVKELEDNCEDSTPANIVDALLKFVKKTACGGAAKQKRSIIMKREIKHAYLSSRGYVGKFKALMTETCKANGGSYEKLIEKVRPFEACVRNKGLHLGTPKNELKDYLMTCSTDLVKAMEDCLSDNEKYFAAFVRDTVVSMVDFLYEHKQHYFSIISGTNSNFKHCAQILNSPENKKLPNQCMENSKMGVDTHESLLQIPSKDELCERVTNLDKCMVDVIHTACPPDVTMEKLLKDFVKAIESPCIS